MNHTPSKQPSLYCSLQEADPNLTREQSHLLACLKASEFRASQRLAAMPHIIWIATDEGAITEFNPRWYEYTGLSEAQSLGWGFLNAIAPQDRDRVAKEHQQACAKKQPLKIEYRLIASDGSYRWVVEQAGPVFAEDGSVLEWVGTCTLQNKDFEEAVAELEKEQEFLKALLANLSEGIVACDANGVLTLFNPATQKFHGLPQEPILAEEWATHYDLYNPDGNTPLRKENIPLFRALNGETVRDLEMVIKPKNGDKRTLLASGNAIINGKGEKLGAVVVMRDITERKWVEAALQQQALAFANISDAVVITDLEGRITEWNPAAEKMFGYSKAEVFGKTPAIMHRPEDAPTLTEQVMNIIQREERWEGEIQFIRKDGSESICEAVVVPLHDANGQLIGSIGVNRDISDRIAAAAQIRALNAELEQRVMERTQQLETANQEKDELITREQAAKERYRALADAMPLLVWTAKPNGDIDYYNQRWLDCTGMTLEQTQGSGWHSVIHPQDLPKCINSWATALSTGEPYEVECRYRRYDGVYRWHLARALPVQDSSGQILYWVGTGTDIDDRKQIEEEKTRLIASLQESEARFRIMADTAPVMVWMSGTDAQCNWFNKPWLDFGGRTMAQEIGNGWAEGVHPADFQRCLDTYLTAFNARQPFKMEYRLRRSDGEYRWLLDNGIPRFTPNGEFAGYIGCCIDINDRIAAEQALKARAEELTYLTTVLAQTNITLEKRNQELDQFAYVASHDLKAPLRAIANLSQWIEEDIEHLLSDENKHQMNLLRGRVHRLEALIDGLLQYSRVGRINSKTELVDVQALLVEVLNIIAPPPSFTVAIGQGMPTFVTQSLPLSQVFANLITNGIKHHHREVGQIIVSVEDKGQFYEFAVTDDGPGIDSKFHDKIFAIFQTLEPRDKVESTGVGLAIVKKIVESQGGSIDLESHPGQGATFRFTWPKQAL